MLRVTADHRERRKFALLISPVVGKSGGMLESGNLIITLISICIGLLVILLLLTWAMLVRLGRLERKAQREIALTDVAEVPLNPVETSPGGAFEAFLKEDSARLSLTKSEQFKAYRQWRQDKGMNWTNS